jgi:sugar phosphate isomerase/epimerase
VERPRIAIGAWAYIRGGHARNPIPLAAVLAQLRDLGCDGVELAAWPPHLTAAERASGAQRRALRARLDDHGLAVPLLIGDFGAVPPAHAAPGDYVAAVEAHLDLCQDLGIANLRVDSVSPAPGPAAMRDHEAALGRMARAWEQAARVANRAGVRLVWEFEAGLLAGRPAQVARLAGAVAGPGFAVLFDFFHAYASAVLGTGPAGPPETLPGGIAQLAHLLVGRIGHVHLSDAVRGPEGLPVRPPLGAGDVDLDGAVRAVRQAGYAGPWWTIDLGTLCPDAPAAAAAAARAAVALMTRAGTVS